MTHRTAIRVRFADVDSAGIVYYPRLLHYCHVAMEEFFRQALGVDYADLIGRQRLGYPAVHLEADFRRPLRYGDEVEVEVEIEAAGTTSLTWRFALFRKGEPETLARVRVVTVGLDLTTFEKRPVPPWIAAARETGG